MSIPNEIFIDYSDLKKTTLDQSNVSFDLSYRPISQLSSISKTSERVVSTHTQLINYIMPGHMGPLLLLINIKKRIFLIVVLKLPLLLSLMIF